MKLTNAVKKFILDNNLVSKSDHIIIGVSGGSDSISLLNILYDLQFELRITICVAHFNHNLRDDSINDQKLVENISKKLNLKLYTESWTGKKPTSNIEEAARKKRLAFFKKIAKKERTNLIALAHTKDDQAETILMKIIRGTGLSGSKGISAKKDIDGLTIIRPLLETNKIQLINYLDNKKIKYYEDKTNKESLFFRNKIRNQLIPFLQKEFNNNIIDALCNLANTSATDYDFIDKEVQFDFKENVRLLNDKTGYSINKIFFDNTHSCLKRYLIRKCIYNLNGNTNKLSFNHLKEIEDLALNRPINSIVDLPNNISVLKTNKSYQIILISK